MPLYSVQYVQMRNVIKEIFVFFAVALAVKTPGAICLSFRNPTRPLKNDGGCIPTSSDMILPRRTVIKNTFNSFLMTNAVIIFPVRGASAACLPGDVSADCIGVYKIPLLRNNGNINQFVDKNRSALKQFAPDIKTDNVPVIGMPKDPMEAWQVLQAQRLAADDIVAVIRQGKLEEGGVKILNLLPRVGMAGQLMIQTSLSSSTLVNDSALSAVEEENKQQQKKASIQQLKEMQLESALNSVLNSFGECDIMIGQGIRGEMGAITAAQIHILNELRDAIRAYDDFLAIVQVNTDFG